MGELLERARAEHADDDERALRKCPVQIERDEALVEAAHWREEWCKLINERRVARKRERQLLLEVAKLKAERDEAELAAYRAQR